jgi:hypothetical protein
MASRARERARAKLARKVELSADQLDKMTEKEVRTYIKEAFARSRRGLPSPKSDAVSNGELVACYALFRKVKDQALKEGNYRIAKVWRKSKEGQRRLARIKVARVDFRQLEKDMGWAPRRGNNFQDMIRGKCRRASARKVWLASKKELVS